MSVDTEQRVTAGLGPGALSGANHGGDTTWSSPPVRVSAALATASVTVKPAESDVLRRPGRGIAVALLAVGLFLDYRRRIARTGRPFRGLRAGVCHRWSYVIGRVHRAPAPAAEE